MGSWLVRCLFLCALISTGEPYSSPLLVSQLVLCFAGMRVSASVSMSSILDANRNGELQYLYYICRSLFSGVRRTFCHNFPCSCSRLPQHSIQSPSPTRHPLRFNTRHHIDRRKARPWPSTLIGHTIPRTPATMLPSREQSRKRIARGIIFCPSLAV